MYFFEAILVIVFLTIMVMSIISAKYYSDLSNDYDDINDQIAANSGTTSPGTTSPGTTSPGTTSSGNTRDLWYMYEPIMHTNRVIERNIPQLPSINSSEAKTVMTMNIFGAIISGLGILGIAYLIYSDFSSETPPVTPSSPTTVTPSSSDYSAKAAVIAADLGW